MRIDGQEIASTIFADLKKRIEKLKKKQITPHLVVMLVGNDQASHAYVKQKQKKGEEIGALVTVQMYGEDATTDQLLTEILKLNQDPLVHAIVVQQPLPGHIDTQKLVDNTDPKKDVDGFHIDSSFTPPIAEAAIHALDTIRFHLVQGGTLTEWLAAKRIVVIGKGETGGAPIIAKLQKLAIALKTIDSKTENPTGVMRQADIIISCVGKSGIIKADFLKKGVVLIGIGMHRGSDGKLHGDYEENDIKNIASYYTPIPGGIGPVNVAMLLKNVLIASEKSML
ncbi:MAG: bifunctional 5,10-methylenetetrahydrofolate dehydrogenase/5,10-methenyltetrahydrofolate cyclohydrolase [Candidatus Levybacteria bacterium]|nr:bifunctional 5,10-methylenetetrahydrofolate dehydrogenase/5,10-methenyltetrahydrofolate cyclohydrolase [Candidatus Levybacteria bacterium]